MCSGNISISYIFVVFYVPIELNQSVTSPSVICQGSDVTLQCVILRNGVPVDIRWRRNGTLVDTNVLTNHDTVFNNTFNALTDLVITNVTLQDNNVQYSCSDITNNIVSSVVLNVTGRVICKYTYVLYVYTMYVRVYSSLCKMMS